MLSRIEHETQSTEDPSKSHRSSDEGRIEGQSIQRRYATKIMSLEKQAQLIPCPPVPVRRPKARTRQKRRRATK